MFTVFQKRKPPYCCP